MMGPRWGSTGKSLSWMGSHQLESCRMNLRNSWKFWSRTPPNFGGFGLVVAGLDGIEDICDLTGEIDRCVVVRDGRGGKEGNVDLIGDIDRCFLSALRFFGLESPSGSPWASGSACSFLGLTGEGSMVLVSAGCGGVSALDLFFKPWCSLRSGGRSGCVVGLRWLV